MRHLVAAASIKSTTSRVERVLHVCVHVYAYLYGSLCRLPLTASVLITGALFINCVCVCVCVWAIHCVIVIVTAYIYIYILMSF